MTVSKCQKGVGNPRESPHVSFDFFFVQITSPVHHPMHDTRQDNTTLVADQAKNISGLWACVTAELSAQLYCQELAGDTPATLPSNPCSIDFSSRTQSKCGFPPHCYTLKLRFFVSPIMQQVLTSQKLQSTQMGPPQVLIYTDGSADEIEPVQELQSVAWSVDLQSLSAIGHN